MSSSRSKKLHVGIVTGRDVPHIHALQLSWHWPNHTLRPQDCDYHVLDYLSPVPRRIWQQCFQACVGRSLLVIAIFYACHRQVAARIQGNQDHNGDEESKFIKRSFKAELRDALTVVSKLYHFLAFCNVSCHAKNFAAGSNDG